MGAVCEMTLMDALYTEGAFAGFTDQARMVRAADYTDECSPPRAGASARTTFASREARARSAAR